ncbi:MAG: DUF429 domain-containing protein [bacterium]
MKPSLTPPSRILGLDFSGAADAGRAIWLAEGRAEADGLRVTDCRPAEALPGGGTAREPALAALRQYLSALGHYAIGMDFPFSLHRSLVPEGSLAEFLAAFPGRYATPEIFREACRKVTGVGSERVLKRRCDLEARTPFAPHNLRVYRQTWYGITALLAPLSVGGARILPVQKPEEKSPSQKPWLLETCPASALKAAGRCVPYKGRTIAHRAGREAIVDWLEAGGVSWGNGVRRSALLDDAGGDALDSVICAWIAWRAVSDPGRLFPAPGPEQRVEGYVYF